MAANDDFQPTDDEPCKRVNIYRDEFGLAHAIGGLSENDFILAAKIDALPIELAKG